MDELVVDGRCQGTSDSVTLRSLRVPKILFVGLPHREGSHGRSVVF